MSVGPWRAVAFIGSQIGDQGGRAWRLVLDVCGHIEWRKQPPIGPQHSFTRKRLVKAPHLVRCTSCAAGVEPWDVGESVALAQRIEEHASGGPNRSRLPGK